MELERKFKIEKSAAGLPVGVFLKTQVGISSSLLKKLKHLDRGIVLNKKRVFVTEILKEGDSLSIFLGDNKSSENILPVEGEIEIIFEDEDLLVINKPPALPVHPSKGHPYDSLANRVAYYFKSKSESFIFRCVTRLDKDTSGVCLIAKNSHAHKLLSEALQRSEIKKQYKAVVVGKFDREKGIIEKNIRRIPNTATIKREVCDSSDGAIAITEFERIKIKDNFSLLKVILHTGRTHQIRVHFASEGFPLAGDWLYGREGGEINRQALHCEKLELLHPITKEALVFFAPLPNDMKKLID